MINSLIQHNIDTTSILLMCILIGYYVMLPIIKKIIKINKELKEEEIIEEVKEGVVLCK